ncbi:MAG TPA: hypothetical protein VJT33_16110 [bacterium]|nr:hypothetical protein [bacterium]
MSWFGKSSGLSPEDRARLRAEGTPADEVAWIDNWLREKRGRTLEDLAEEEAALIAVLRSYRGLVEELSNSRTPVSMWQDRLKAARETATASLAQIDRAVLVRGFAEISASDTVKLFHNNISLGLIRTALAGRADRHRRST